MFVYLTYETAITKNTLERRARELKKLLYMITETLNEAVAVACGILYDRCDVLSEILFL